MSAGLLELSALEEVLSGLDGPLKPPFQITRLDGGYSWQTYRVDAADARAVILRIAPSGGTMEPYDPELEAQNIRAVAGVVPVPPILGVESSRFGEAFSIHGVLPGSTVRPSAQISEADRQLYRDAFCSALGRIHSVAPESSITVTEAIRLELQTSYEHYRRTTPWVHPGFEIGYRWLCTNIPETQERAVLCHGDFRLANLLWTGAGDLSGVLDWERAWLGDPMSDVAFTRLFSGWCCVSGDSVSTYEAEAGRKVDEARVEYATRFERWRSFTSSIRGMRAFLDGRNSDPRLLGIGLAGDMGAWDLVEWLEPGLVPLDKNLVSETNVPHIPCEWLSTNRPELHAQLLDADEASQADSLVALAAVRLPELSDAIAEPDQGSAWDSAFRVLAQEARTAGDELIPALKALAVRAQGRPHLRAADLS